MLTAAWDFNVVTKHTNAIFAMNMQAGRCIKLGICVMAWPYEVISMK